MRLSLTNILKYLIGIFAEGPGAYLFHGVVEQQYIFHVLDHALCLSQSKQNSCFRLGDRRQMDINSAANEKLSISSMFAGILLLRVLQFLWTWKDFHFSSLRIPTYNFWKIILLTWSLTVSVNLKLDYHFSSLRTPSYNFWKIILLTWSLVTFVLGNRFRINVT